MAMSSLFVNSLKASSMALTDVSALISTHSVTKQLKFRAATMWFHPSLLSVTTRKLDLRLRSTLPTPASKKPVTVSCDKDSHKERNMLLKGACAHSINLIANNC